MKNSNPTLSGIAAIILFNTLGSVSGGAPTHEQRFARLSDTKGAQALIELRNSPSAELRLRREPDIAEFSLCTTNWTTLPKRVFLEPTIYNGVQARVAVHQVGNSSNDTVYACFHGILSQAEDWRHVAGALSGKHELWLIDLPGCGQSDCLEPRSAGQGGYSPRALADRVLQALSARLAERPQVSRVIMVGHSFGGLVVLRMFADDEVRLRHAQVLDRVQGLALFAPADVVVQATETWKAFLSIDPVKARLGGMLQILQAKVADSVRDGFRKPDLASREMAIEGIQTLRDGPHRRAMQQIMLEAIPWRGRDFGKHPDWAKAHDLEDGYRNVTAPCLIVWGKCDETLPEAMGHKLNDQLPNSRLVLLADTMHLLPLERPVACAELLQQFSRELETGKLAAVRSVTNLELTEGGKAFTVAGE